MLEENEEQVPIALYAVAFRDSLTGAREVVVLHGRGEIDAMICVTDECSNPIEDVRVTPLGDLQIGIIRTVYKDKENGRKDHGRVQQQGNP